MRPRLALRSLLMPRGRQRPGGLYAVAHPISEKAVKQPGIAAGQLKGLQWMVKLNGILADKIMMVSNDTLGFYTASHTIAGSR